MHLPRPSTPEINLTRDAFDRSLGVQLERPPGHVHEAIPLELFDPYRVDVAPGSNVVGEDDQLHRIHGDCSKHPLINRWHNGFEGGGALNSFPGSSEFRRYAYGRDEDGCRERPGMDRPVEH